MKIELGGLIAAISTFTIIPMPSVNISEKSFGRSLVWLPASGVVIGALWSLGAWVCFLLQDLGVHPLLCAAICGAIPVVLSGFIHLDGFMDCCDALLSRRSQEEKLRILKDPNCGAFSVISLLLAGSLFIPAVGGILAINKGIFLLGAIPILSRCLAVLTLLTTPVLGSSRLAAASSASRYKSDKLVQSIILLSAIIFIGSFIGLWAAVAVSLALIPFALALRHCKSQLGGANGDVAGFLIVVFEVAACVLCAVIGGIFG